MPANISFISTAASASQTAESAVPAHSTALSESAPLAAEILHNAPASLEHSLNEAKEMTAVPERDIPKETLDKRNEETDETLAGRDLASALERNDAKTAGLAAEKLEGRTENAALQNMVKQAKLCKAESAGHSAETDGTAETQREKNTASPAENQKAPLSVQSKQAEQAEESAAQTEQLQDPAVITPNRELKDIPDTIGTESEDCIHDLNISLETLDILIKLESGGLGPQHLSLDKMHELNTKLEQLIDMPLAHENDEESYHSMLKASLMEKSVQLANCIASREHLNERLDDLEKLRNAETDREQGMEALANLALAWQNGKKQTELMVSLANGDPQAFQEIAEGAGARIGIVGADLDRFEKEFAETSAVLLKRFLPADFHTENEKKEDGMHTLHETLAWLSRFCLRAGERPENVLDKLMQGLSWTKSAGHRKTLLGILSSAMESAAEAQAKNEFDAAKCSEILSYVDMIFQGVYPEHAETALELKKLLLPDHEDQVNLQHQCLIAGRHLMNLIISDQASSQKTRGVALDRTFRGMGSASARSILLTPSAVAELKTRISIPDLNYHIAHVALLQKKAAEAGLIAITAEELKTIGAKEWYDKLGLDEDAALYAKNLEGQLDNELHMDALQRACDLFMQGFRGTNDVSEAVSRLEKHSALTKSPKAGRREHHLYESSPAYLARLALDRQIINLAGLLRPEDRFAEGDDAMNFDGNAIDAAMNRQTNALYQNLLGSESLQELRQAARTVKTKQQDLVNKASEFKLHANNMKTLAQSASELIRLRTEQTALSKNFGAMELDKALIQKTWPHRRAGRMNVCNTVLEIEKQCKELDLTPETADISQYGEIQKLLDSLQGINPRTLARSRHFKDKTPDLETVLELMLPRARALNFFEGPPTSATPLKTEAEEILRQIRVIRSDIKHERQKIDSILKSLKKQLGKNNIRQLQQTITAGLYKVFAESQKPAAAFSVHDPETMQAVYDQLRAWGLPVQSEFTDSLIKLTLASATLGNGTLNIKKLKHDALNDKLEFAGKENIKAEMQKTGLQENKFLTMPKRKEALQKQRELINSTLLSDERRRTEGIRLLMREASKPGSGFVYDRTRGMAVDTGRVFNPASSPTQLVHKINIGHPLTARLRLMLNDSLTVCNTGGGSYQVIIKGGLASSIGSTIKTAIPGSPVMINVGANIRNKNDQGLALGFANANDCENFLNIFMHPKKEGFSGQSALSALTAATQIRFIDGNAVSSDLSLGIVTSLFQESLGNLAVVGGAMAGLGLGGELTRQTEQNSMGETTTFSMRGKLSVTAAAFAGAISNATAIITPKTTKAKSLMLDITQRFKLTSGPKGLMPSSCAETECPVMALKNRLARRMLLPSAVRRQMDENPAFSSALENLINKMPPSASLVIHRALKPSVLEDVRKLFIQARMSTSNTEQDSILKKAHTLLASLDSYTPTHLSVKNAAPSAISRNWSPGLGAFQYVRNTSFARFQTSDPLAIPLPQAE